MSKSLHGIVCQRTSGHELSTTHAAYIQLTLSNIQSGWAEAHSEGSAQGRLGARRGGRVYKGVLLLTGEKPVDGAAPSPQKKWNSSPKMARFGAFSVAFVVRAPRTKNVKFSTGSGARAATSFRSLWGGGRSAPRPPINPPERPS